jgi:hypothetical protein
MGIGSESRERAGGLNIKLGRVPVLRRCHSVWSRCVGVEIMFREVVVKWRVSVSTTESEIADHIGYLLFS